MSLSKRNFPNLNRTLPRIESEVYNKIEEVDETNNNDGTPQTSSVSQPSLVNNIIKRRVHVTLNWNSIVCFTNLGLNKYLKCELG